MIRRAFLCLPFLDVFCKLLPKPKPKDFLTDIINWDENGNRYVVETVSSDEFYRKYMPWLRRKA